MTLQPKTKRRSTPHSLKRQGRHHKHSQHYLKSYWPYLPVLAVLSVGLLLNSWVSHAHRSVLGYATDMSISSLLADTNQQRSANGEASLNLNSQLDQAAQAKANDMAARDYWSHNTPDGQSPWTFITAAGYSYSTAGENLAYGFATAADTLNGWMNSPGHRANILNASFVDVGFGIIDIPNYQNTGPQTLVVAMYAAPYVVTTPAPTVPQTPVASKPSSTTPTPTSQSTPTASEDAAQPTASSPTSDTLTPSTNKPISVSAEVKAQPSPEPNSTPLSRIQLASGNQLATAGATFLAMGILFAFAVRHSKAWHRVLVRGERFVLRHPALDAAGAALLVICLLLSQTTGLIR